MQFHLGVSGLIAFNFQLVLVLLRFEIDGGGGGTIGQ